MADMMEYQYGINLANHGLLTFQKASSLQNDLSSLAGSCIVNLGSMIGPFLMTFIRNMVLPLGITWAYHRSPFQNLYPILVARENVLKFFARLTAIAVVISVAALTLTANGKVLQN